MTTQQAGLWDALWTNVQMATMGAATQGYGKILDATVAIKDGLIAWVGRRVDLPPRATATTVHDGRGGWMTPGLIDCHTHVVYAGDRSDEFETRLTGASYEEIARRGILSTVRATRAASEDQLLAESLTRVRRLMSEGVTTIEVKSGYGIACDAEVKMLRVARRVADARAGARHDNIPRSTCTAARVHWPPRRLHQYLHRGDASCRNPASSG
jgi:imidazolonepropionase